MSTADQTTREPPQPALVDVAVPSEAPPSSPKQRSRLPRSRVRFRDAISIGTRGLRARPGRTALTALGIAIGIASMISVLGITESSRADVVAKIEQLGTNMLQVQAGDALFGDEAVLPKESVIMVRRIGPVENASSVATLGTSVYRNEYFDDANALDVHATEPQLLDTLQGEVHIGRFIDDQTATLPTVVLGAVASERLGIYDLDGAPAVLIAGKRFAVIGILRPLPLNPDLDRSVMIGTPAAEEYLRADTDPTTIYVRTTPDQVTAVQGVLARTANPANPSEVAVSNPSDALQARAEVDEGFRTMLLGLGAVALLVGGVGIANVMIISVLERRSEIGVRRALGATRRHIATQFLIESSALSLLGGVAGVVLGAVVTIGYASYQGWQIAIPTWGLLAAIAATLALGIVAGLYPALRAARLDPAEAVRPGG